MNKPRYVRGSVRTGCGAFSAVELIFKHLVIAIMLVGVVTIGLVAYKLYPTVKGWYDDSNAIAQASTYDDFRNDETSYIYDDAGNVLLKLKQDKDVQYVKYDDMPESVLNAFVAIEDKRFYQHHGVDWASTFKAVYLLFKHNGEVTRGGSTITQQLARNVYLSFETSYERKAREIFLALALEKKYSKQEILEFYINNINFANGYYGIGAAANGYFGKSVNELSVEEVAFLCAIPNNPSYYNPRQHFDNTISRRNIILKEMWSQGYLTKSEYLKACNAACHLKESEDTYNDYAASYALRCAVEEFMSLAGFEFRYSFESSQDFTEYRERYEDAYDEAKLRLYTGGYKVYTSLNVGVQRGLQQIMDDNLSEFTKTNEDGSYVVQGAATVVDNKTGLVVASIGGRSDESNSYLALNRAFQSYKQPGSTIKPLVVYTPSLERGYTADSIVSDTPIADGPRNSGNSYLGEITLRTAVEKSKNVVAWRLFDELTPRVGLRYLQDMQFDKIVPDDYYLPSALGGLTWGVTTEQMAGAYSALENSGVWTKPTCLVSIKDVDNNEVYSGAKQLQVYTEDAANAMTDILQGVHLQGTATGIALNNDFEFACKTGTTNDNKAAWFCGYSPYYSIAVYIGADNNSVSIDGLWGGTYPAYVWRDMQNYLLTDKTVIPLIEKDVVIEGQLGEQEDGRDEFVEPDSSVQQKSAAHQPDDVVENVTAPVVEETVPVDTTPTESVTQTDTPQESDSTTSVPSAPESSEVVEETPEPTEVPTESAVDSTESLHEDATESKHEESSESSNETEQP